MFSPRIYMAAMRQHAIPNATATSIPCCWMRSWLQAGIAAKENRARARGKEYEAKRGRNRNIEYPCLKVYHPRTDIPSDWQNSFSACYRISMRATMFMLLVFFSFSIGVSAAYMLLSPIRSGDSAPFPYRARDIAHENTKIRGVVAQVDVETRTILLESASPFSAVTKIRLRIGYGDRGISSAVASSTSTITPAIVGSFVGMVVRNQPGPLQAGFVGA